MLSKRRDRKQRFAKRCQSSIVTFWLHCFSQWKPSLTVCIGIVLHKVTCWHLQFPRAFRYEATATDRREPQTRKRNASSIVSIVQFRDRVVTLRKQLYWAIQNQMLCTCCMMWDYTEAKEWCQLNDDYCTGRRGLGQHGVLCITQDAGANGSNMSERSLFMFDVLNHALWMRSADEIKPPACHAINRLAPWMILEQKWGVASK